MKTTPLPLALVLSLAALLTACFKPSTRTTASVEKAAVVAQDSITGTVAYRERMALPPDAVLHVQLQDVSKQDAAATIIATTTVAARGRQVPLSFTLPYDTLRIDPTNTYTVQARIEAAGRLLFTTDAAYPVITRGNSRQVQMVLRWAGK